MKLVPGVFLGFEGRVGSMGAEPGGGMGLRGSHPF